MSSKLDKIVRKEVRNVLREYEEKSVVELVGVEGSSETGGPVLVFKKVEGPDLTDASAGALFDSVKPYLNFVKDVRVSRSKQSIYVIHKNSRISADTVKNLANTQFRA